jgi:hypothetical protein
MPAGTGPQLIRLPKRPLRKRVHIALRRHSRVALASSIIIIAVLIIVGVVWFWPQHVNTLPVSVTNQARGFTVYAYNTAPPNNFQIDAKSAQYTDGVLFFHMTNSGGQSITVSEQTLPSDISGIPQGSQKVSVKDGNATISTAGGRTVGLLSVPRTHTMILLNTTDAVGTTVLTNLLQTLQAQ